MDSHPLHDTMAPGSTSNSRRTSPSVHNSVNSPAFLSSGIHSGIGGSAGSQFSGHSASLHAHHVVDDVEPIPSTGPPADGRWSQGHSPASHTAAVDDDDALLSKNRTVSLYQMVCCFNKVKPLCSWAVAGPHGLVALFCRVIGHRPRACENEDQRGADNV